MAAFARRTRRMVGIGLLMGGMLLTGIGMVIAKTPAQQGTRLPYNTVVHGQIMESTSEESWRFNGQSGDWVLIDMRAIASGLDVSLTLLGPDGNQLLTDDDGGPGFNARLGPYELPETGDYTILAGHYSGQGEYALDLRNLRTQPAIAPDKPLVGVVNGENPNDVFTLELPADTAEDTLWQLAVSTEQRSANPIIALYGQAGFVDSSEDQADASALDPILLVPGETYIVVASWNVNGYGGEYELTLRNSTRELLTDGANQTGSLDNTTPNYTHYFRAEAGQTVRISLRTRDDIAPAVEIHSVDYDTHLYYNDGEYTRELRITLAIPVTTVYAIDVRNGSFEGNRGEYSLDFEVIGE